MTPSLGALDSRDLTFEGIPRRDRVEQRLDSPLERGPIMEGAMPATRWCE
jgi:hypothetical protein